MRGFDFFSKLLLLILVLATPILLLSPKTAYAIGDSSVATITKIDFGPNVSQLPRGYSADFTVPDGITEPFGTVTFLNDSMPIEGCANLPTALILGKLRANCHTDQELTTITAVINETGIVNEAINL